VGTVVVLGRLSDLFLVRPGAPVARFPDVRRGPPADGSLPAGLVRALKESVPDDRLAADTEVRRESVRAALGRPVELAPIELLRSARHELPPVEARAERDWILGWSEARLESVLASPEEILISLAREEERLERAVGREARAAEAFLAPEGSSLREYAVDWARVRRALDAHHDALAERLGRQTREVAPNLAAVVGERVAARLISLAGGLGPLGRMRAPRLQLLGTRRRPGPERGPRFGVIFRADRMGDVPPDRRGAYARSLAAIAAIAARADATTRADLRRPLLARRDRRVEQLRRRAA
jgi:hypothetical protein